MGTTRCYYEVLNIERTASGDEVKRSYRRLAMKYHPDRNPGDTEAEAAFKEAAEAYEVLSDSERRLTIDSVEMVCVPDQDMTSGRCTSRTSSCSTTLGKRRWRSRSRRQSVRGYDLETEVQITLQDVLAGVETEVVFPRLDVCDTCEGSGARPARRRPSAPHAVVVRLNRPVWVVVPHGDELSGLQGPRDGRHGFMRLLSWSWANECRPQALQSSRRDPRRPGCSASGRGRAAAGGSRPFRICGRGIPCGLSCGIA